MTPEWRLRCGLQPSQASAVGRLVSQCLRSRSQGDADKHDPQAWPGEDCLPGCSPEAMAGSGGGGECHVAGFPHGDERIFTNTVMDVEVGRSVIRDRRFPSGGGARLGFAGFVVAVALSTSCCGEPQRTTAPPLITPAAVSSKRTFFSGSPSTAIMSPYLPTMRLPTSFSRIITLAASSVAARIACMGVMP